MLTDKEFDSQIACFTAKPYNNIEIRKEKDRIKARKYRELHPNYNKNYANSIKNIFNEKYKETIKNNAKQYYNKNKNKLKAQYLMKKEFLIFCKMQQNCF